MQQPEEKENTQPKKDAGSTPAKNNADTGTAKANDAAGKAGSQSDRKVKTITVNSGDGSYTVARKLADAGVVTSAENFDEYLCSNGYDKRLRTGTFSIPADAGDEQIARIVTGAE